MKVNINKADLDRLQDIIHVGPVTAAKIIERRTLRKFRDVHELSFINGLGKKKMAKIIEQGIAEV